jgi:hypothetical protein
MKNFEDLKKGNEFYIINPTAISSISNCCLLKDPKNLEFEVMINGLYTAIIKLNPSSSKESICHNYYLVEWVGYKIGRHVMRNIVFSDKEELKNFLKNSYGTTRSINDCRRKRAV